MKYQETGEFHEKDTDLPRRCAYREFVNGDACHTHGKAMSGGD